MLKLLNKKEPASIAIIIVIVFGVLILGNIIYYRSLSKDAEDIKNLPLFDLSDVEIEKTANWDSYTYRDLWFTIKYPSDWEVIQEWQGEALGKYPWIINENLGCMFQIADKPFTESTEYLEITKKRIILDNKETLLVEYRDAPRNTLQKLSTNPRSVFINLGDSRNYFNFKIWKISSWGAELSDDCMNDFYLIISTAHF